MPIISLGTALVPSQMDLFGVHDDDVVTTIHIWGEGWLVLYRARAQQQVMQDDQERDRLRQLQTSFSQYFWRRNIGPWQRHVIISS